MIIATYKQWFDSELSGYYQESTSVYEDKSKLLEEIKHREKEGNPLIITAIWEL